MERPCCFPRKGRINQMILLKKKAAKEDKEDIILDPGGRNNHNKRPDPHYGCCGKNGHDA